MTDTRYPRDLRGYGRNPPHPQWPGDAKVAVQFVVNFEEGGENNILHGDRASEAFLSDVLGAQPWPGQRHANIESMFEYGSRAGFWRLWRMFNERKWPTTVFGVATALKRNPEIVAAMNEAGWDIASHSLKWIEHKDMTEAQERAEIAESIRVHTDATGSRPLGWYTGRSSINTLRLLMEAGGLLYLCDSYADDLPYWIKSPGLKPHLVIPYTLDANVMRLGNDQMRLRTTRPDPVWQVVGVGVAEIKQTAGFHQKPERIDRGASGVPAERGCAGRLGVDAHRRRDLDALLGLRHVLVLDPFQAVAGNVPAGLLHGRDHVRVPL